MGEDCVPEGSSKTSFEHLEEVCELIIKEEELVPESVRPYFFGARLIAISKGENKGVRPIAIGTILRKVISSAIAINVKSRLPSFFGPCQCGVGMPGGAENVVHGVRMLLEDDPGNVVVHWICPMHSTQ